MCAADECRRRGCAADVAWRGQGGDYLCSTGDIGRLAVLSWLQADHLRGGRECARLGLPIPVSFSLCALQIGLLETGSFPAPRSLPSNDALEEMYLRNSALLREVSVFRQNLEQFLLSVPLIKVVKTHGKPARLWEFYYFCSCCT